MNAREGMRRLGLVAGLLGALVGCLISYLHATDVSERRAKHKQFMELVSGPVLRQEFADIKAIASAQSPSQGWLERNEAGIKPQPPPDYHFVPPKGTAEAVLAGWSTGWTVGRAGIAKIFFEKNKDGIASIEMENGERLYDFVSGSIAEYLLVTLFPIVGFLPPWGLSKTLTWIGSGFVKT